MHDQQRVQISVLVISVVYNEDCYVQVLTNGVIWALLISVKASY